MVLKRMFYGGYDENLRDNVWCGMILSMGTMSGENLCLDLINGMIHTY